MYASVWCSIISYVSLFRWSATVRHKHPPGNWHTSKNTSMYQLYKQLCEDKREVFFAFLKWSSENISAHDCGGVGAHSLGEFGLLVVAVDSAVVLAARRGRQIGHGLEQTLQPTSLGDFSSFFCFLLLIGRFTDRDNSPLLFYCSLLVAVKYEGTRPLNSDTLPYWPE